MRTLVSTVLVLSLALCFTRGTTATPGVEETAFEGLDGFVASAMKEWGVPGLAVAAVKDGNVVFSRGYGYRDVEKKQPVTSRTLFAIGSVSKSFTVTVLGMLSDDGKLDWDAPVRTYLPDFQLRDTVATERMTPRDLVTHRCGLPRHDAVWYGSSFTGKELYDRLRFLEPSEEFRNHYDIFEASGGRLEGSRITFNYDLDGNIDRVSLPLEPRVDPIVFTRRADPSMKSIAFLKQFVGKYKLGPIVATVTLRGDDTLIIDVPGQPARALVPSHETTFDVEGLTGFSVEFRKDASGEVTEAIGHQPAGSLVARRVVEERSRRF